MPLGSGAHDSSRDRERPGGSRSEDEMLTTSVLNILGRRQPEEIPRAERPQAVEKFREPETPEPRSSPKIVVDPPFPGMKRPILPEYLPGQPLANQRSFEEFLKALDDVNRVNRQPEVDVFE